MAVFWTGLGIFLLVVEALTVQLVGIWFAVGALAAAVPAILGYGFVSQLAVFCLVSGGVLLFGRPPLLAFLQKKPAEKTNLDGIVGKTGFATGVITRDSGRALVAGMSWKAQATTLAPIPAGSPVLVEKIVGATLVVSPLAR